MRIGILGIGNVGSALGKRWLDDGNEVVFGARDPRAEKVQTLLESLGPGARAQSVKDAAEWADIVVLAVPWTAAHDAIRAAGNLEGKILVDCTNPIADGLKGLTVGLNTSAGEQVAGWAPGARVVKAFNTTSVRNMLDPRFGSERLTMFICGDDAPAKRVVTALAQEMGFEVCDTGPLYHARYLEPLAILWVDMAYLQGMGQDFAFKLIRR